MSAALDRKTEILAATRGGLDYYLAHVPGLKAPLGRRCRNARNPFYDDRKASLSIWRDRDVWLHKDHGDERYTGDVFAFAAHVHRLDAQRDFVALLKAMADELNLPNATPKAELLRATALSAKGLAFWQGYGIGPEWLARYGICQVSHTR